MKYDLESFIVKSNNVHNARYDYSLVVYKVSSKKVKIICNAHGVFEQTPTKHWSGQGCPMCCNNIKKDNESFINKAIYVHGDKYDYSLVNYKNSALKIKIICPIHGVFSQQANSHLQGKGCLNCSVVSRTDKRKSSKEIFIVKANKIHKNKYDYSLCVYKNNKTLIDIICLKHGVFKQRPDCHLHSKQGCPKCGGTARILLPEFIYRGKERHENFFDYSLVNFKSVLDKVDIICPKHGVFSQNVKAHLDGNACPRCKTSKLEKKVLKELKSTIDDIHIIQFYKSEWLGRQHIDIFLPEYSIGIECQGIQHYEPIEIFGGEKTFKKRVELDIKKRKLCVENKIILYEIPYFYTKIELLEVIEKIKNKIYL